MGEDWRASLSRRSLSVSRDRINLERLQTQLPQQLDLENGCIGVLARHATLLRCRLNRIDPPRRFWEQVA